MSLDESLLATLRDNGRLPVSEISRRLGVPRHRIDERMHSLIEDGSLRFEANVHPALLGIRHYCHLLLWVEGSTAPVTRQLCAMPDVPLVSAVAGDHDITVEIGARDRELLDDALRAIRSIPGVRTTRASVHTRSFVSRFGIDADLAAADFPPLDSVDRRLVDLLRTDGRLPYRQLSARVGLSIGAVRTRVTRLIDSGMLRITCVSHRLDTRRSFVAGIGINTLGDPGCLEALVTDLQSDPAVEFGALTIGHFDLIATLSAPSLHTLREALDRIKRSRSVQQVASWMHLDIERESYEVQ